VADAREAPGLPAELQTLNCDYTAGLSVAKNAARGRDNNKRPCVDALTADLQALEWTHG
jgi:hypothetical protein